MPGTVESLEVIALSSSSAHISWQPPLDRNGRILDYHINVTQLGDSMGMLSSQAASTSVDVYLLHPDYIYLFYVTPRTNAGLGPSANILFQFPQDGKKMVVGGYSVL